MPAQRKRDEVRDWDTRVKRNLKSIRKKRQCQDSDDRPTEDGNMIGDPTIDHVVVSYDNKFVPLSYGHNRYGAFYTTVTQTAASTNTATAIAWASTALSKDETIDDPHSSRLV